MPVSGDYPYMAEGGAGRQPGPSANTTLPPRQWPTGTERIGNSIIVLLLSKASSKVNLLSDDTY